VNDSSFSNRGRPPSRRGGRRRNWPGGRRSKEWEGLYPGGSRLLSLGRECNVTQREKRSSRRWTRGHYSLKKGKKKREKGRAGFEVAEKGGKKTTIPITVGGKKTSHFPSRGGALGRGGCTFGGRKEKPERAPKCCFYFLEKGGKDLGFRREKKG